MKQQAGQYMAHFWREQQSREVNGAAMDMSQLNLFGTAAQAAPPGGSAAEDVAPLALGGRDTDTTIPLL